jgi:hypothetical protein
MGGKSTPAATRIAAPTNLSAGEWIPPTAIPQALREFGHVPDWSAWHPGDLLLTQSPEPDRVSQQIQSTQALGYLKEFAVWTHAAVYLGDGLMLCEAQFDLPKTCRVIIAKVWEYIGTHHLMLKRSLHAQTVERGWAIAAAAASQLGADYDWKFVLKMAKDRAFLGDKVWLNDRSGKVTAGALVCSSLYSTAHAYVTDVALSDKLNGLCTPAFLAGLEDPHLQTIDFPWKRIRG